MNFFTVSTLILLLTVGTVLGLLGNFNRSVRTTEDSTQNKLMVSNPVEESVVLDDMPPPDDTYTPDHRRYS